MIIKILVVIGFILPEQISK